MSPKIISEMSVRNSTGINSAHVYLKAGGNCVGIRPIFSEDSKYLLVASGWDIKVLSTASGECVKQLSGHTSQIVSLQNNPQNKVQILSCSEDGSLIFWDYLDAIVLKKLKIGHEIQRLFAPIPDLIYFLSNNCLYSASIQTKTLSEPVLVLDEVNPNQHSLAFGPKAEFLALINGTELHIFKPKTVKKITHNSRRNLICVACHPTDNIIATGDDNGCILVWSNPLNKNKVGRSVYHWHALPVTDLAFSANGTHLFSGGGECVLVKWNLQIEDKVFLPRMGLPICQLAIAPDNSFVASAHEDNAICLVSPQNQVVQIYQGLCQGHPWAQGQAWRRESEVNAEDVVPTGLVYDMKTRAMVLNGRPGHLQFYSMHLDKQLFSLDIAGQNYVSAEREGSIPNTIVEKVALDMTSNWLATVQRRDDLKTSPEIVLRIWQWMAETQTYSLNTSVFLPHSDKINCLKFQPIENEPVLVSTSRDCKFKVWALEEENDNSNRTWVCSSMGYYRGLPASNANFSQDGSLLAVVFKHAVTLWIPSNSVSKGTLIEIEPKMIRQIEFGNDNCSHLLAAAGSDFLTVWNLINLSVSWRVKLDNYFLASNPLSEDMALFAKDGNLFVFRLSNPEPIHIQSVSKHPVLCAAFIPDSNNDHIEESFLNNCQLYFMNERQELMVVSKTAEKLSELTEEVTFRAPRIARTQFEALMAQKSKSDVLKQETELHDHNLGNSMMEQLLNIPSHIVPPVSSLCLDFMSSLLITNTKS